MYSKAEGEVSKEPGSEEVGDISGITKKPWGSEELVYLGEYAVKILRIDEDKRTSLHYHKEKIETIFVHSGTLIVEINEGAYDLGPGKNVHISPPDWHRLRAFGGDLVLFEVSTPHLTDVFRVRDDYGRKD